MIGKCNLKGKVVITATQMLESMCNNPRPTRAEASDVANAVLDGTDCAMLSGESAGGDYPIQAVTIMAKICVEAEKTLNYRRVYNDLKLYTPGPVSTTEAVASAVCSAVLDQKDIALIIVLTETGKLARLVSKYRPEVKILGCSANKSVIQQMNATRGAFGMLVANYNADQVVPTCVASAKEAKMVKTGQKIALLHGTNEETPDE